MPPCNAFPAPRVNPRLPPLLSFPPPPPHLFSFFSNDPSSACFKSASSSPKLFSCRSSPLELCQYLDDVRVYLCGIIAGSACNCRFLQRPLILIFRSRFFHRASLSFPLALFQLSLLPPDSCYCWCSLLFVVVFCCWVL
jgi:hypothetical protein